jgi:hypothetical protein
MSLLFPETLIYFCIVRNNKWSCIKLCGAIGGITKLLQVNIGLHNLRNPVDPVGVEIIKPSAQYEFKNSLFK